jgi:hypothetical protein
LVRAHQCLSSYHSSTVKVQRPASDCPERRAPMMGLDDPGVNSGEPREPVLRVPLTEARGGMLAMALGPVKRPACHLSLDRPRPAPLRGRSPRDGVQCTLRDRRSQGKSNDCSTLSRASAQTMVAAGPAPWYPGIWRASRRKRTCVRRPVPALRAGSPGPGG